MSVKDIVKKVMICGTSLLMTMSLSSGIASAKRTTHHTHVNAIRVVKGISSKQFNKLEDTMSNAMPNGFLIPKAKANNLRILLNKWIPKLSTNQIMSLYNNYGLDDYYHNDAISKSNYHYLNTVAKPIVNKEIQQQKQQKQQQEQQQRLAQLSEEKWEATDNVSQLSQQDTDFDTQVRAQMINDINSTRESFGRNPLTVTNIMQQTANYRAPKVQYAYDNYEDYQNYPHNTSNPLDNWIHGGDTHTSGYEYLESQGYSNKAWGANAGEWIYYPNCAYDGVHYDNTTPQQVADNMNDCLMNHDVSGGNNNGHRDNELNPNYKYLGVGVSYNPQTNNGTINEQFAS